MEHYLKIDEPANHIDESITHLYYLFFKPILFKRIVNKALIVCIAYFADLKDELIYYNNSGSPGGNKLQPIGLN